MNTKKNIEKTKSDIICVDCFDTLVSRKHSPKYPSLVWCRKIIDYFGLDISVNKLYWIRRNIVEVCDVPYKESVSNLLKYLKIHFSYDINEEDFYIKSKEFDESAELNEICINKKLINQLRALKLQGKKIFLVSDFYLEKDFFITLFSKHDILDLFDEIYISSEERKTKRDGDLYQFIKNTHKSNSLMMIGDNKKADYQKSQQYGFSSIHYFPFSVKNNRIKYEFNNLKYDKQSFKMYKKIYRRRTKVGLISNYAFSLFDFCERLYKKCIKENIDVLFFQSREGQFLQKLFDIYQDGKYKRIETRYFIASRYSTFLPSLYGKEIKPQTFHSLTGNYKTLSLSKFLENLQFTEKEINSLNIQNIDDKIDNIEESGELLKLLKDDCFLSMFSTKVENSYIEFKKYFDKIFGENENIAIVDAGWKGTMQDNLNNIFRGRNIQGIYLGLNGCASVDNKKKCGLLWSVERTPYSIDLYDFELILKADHGKVVGYKDCQPILQEDGDVVAYEKIVKNIQHDILSKFVDLISTRGDDITCFNQANYLCTMHKKMLKHVGWKFISTIYDISQFHIDDFGILKKEKGIKKASRLRHFISKKLRYIILGITYSKMNNWE